MRSHLTKRARGFCARTSTTRKRSFSQFGEQFRTSVAWRTWMHSSARRRLHSNHSGSLMRRAFCLLCSPLSTFLGMHNKFPIHGLDYLRHKYMHGGSLVPPEDHFARIACPSTRHIGRQENDWMLDPPPLLRRLEALHMLQVREILEGQQASSTLLRHPHQGHRPSNMVRYRLSCTCGEPCVETRVLDDKEWISS